MDVTTMKVKGFGQALPPSLKKRKGRTACLKQRKTQTTHSMMQVWKLYNDRCLLNSRRYTFIVKAEAKEPLNNEKYEYNDEPSVVDLETQAEEFMRQQAFMETGEDPSPSSATQAGIEYGKDEVSDQDVELYKKDVIELVNFLLKDRDMTLNEIKLIVAIEDPRAKEARKIYSIEDDSGVSREELADVLVQVVEKRLITNRLALRELRRELSSWPGVSDNETESADTSEEVNQVPIGDLARPAQQPKIGRGDDDSESVGGKGLADFLPDWMGYGVLYSLSIVPIIITITAVAILWTNSFS